MIDDAMNLALTGRLDYRTALDVTSYLAHERSYVPWKAGLSALGYIDSMLSKGAHYLEYGVSSVKMLNFYYLFSLVMRSSSSTTSSSSSSSSWVTCLRFDALKVTFDCDR